MGVVRRTSMRWSISCLRRRTWNLRALHPLQRGGRPSAEDRPLVSRRFSCSTISRPASRTGASRPRYCTARTRRAPWISVVAAHDGAHWPLLVWIPAPRVARGVLWMRRTAPDTGSGSAGPGLRGSSHTGGRTTQLRTTARADARRHDRHGALWLRRRIPTAPLRGRSRGAH